MVTLLDLRSSVMLILYSAGQTDLIGCCNPRFLELVDAVRLELPAAHSWLVDRDLLRATLAYRTSFRILEWATPWLYGLGLVLLAVVLVAGTGEGHGCWRRASKEAALSYRQVQAGVNRSRSAKLATIP